MHFCNIIADCHFFFSSHFFFSMLLLAGSSDGAEGLSHQAGQRGAEWNQGRYHRDDTENRTWGSYVTFLAYDYNVISRIVAYGCSQTVLLLSS